jgi:uncharacterized membrane protein YhfC
MKKLIAKICIWILGKLGYEKNYAQKNEIIINCNTEQAVKQLKKLSFELDKLKHDLNGL